MKSTAALIATIKEDYANSFTVTKLVSYLDRVQRMIFLDDSFEMEFLNGADPEFPYAILPTVDGVLKYELVDGLLTDSTGAPLNITFEGQPVVASNIHSVFLGNYGRNGLGSSGGYGGAGYRGYGFRNGHRDSRYVTLRGEKFEKAVVALTQVSPNSPPTITFKDNPQSTTDRYFVQFGIVPPEIKSKHTPMSLNIDKWEKALIDGVVGECEESVNGKSARGIKFEEYWIPKIRGSYNDNADEFYAQDVTRREFG